MDPTKGEWTSFAAHRQDRTYLPSRESCPFCPTRGGTPATEVPCDRYDIVVFDNKFPAFTTDPPSPSIEGNDPYEVAAAAGASEVIVYSDDHDATMASLGVDRLARIIEVWANRYANLGVRKEVSYVFIFENKGVEVGVTLHHPHGQIYGYPEIPPVPLAELNAARSYLEKHGRCVFCDQIGRERSDGVRVLGENESFLAFVPFPARFPYETRIMSRRHAPSLLDLSDPERARLAELMQAVLIGYDRLFGFPMPYVMAIHQAPTGDAKWLAVSHFHMEFYPPYRTSKKLKYLAGSELGAGAFLNDTVPEETAAELRRAMAAFDD
ncbi:MAG: galactose-1-phosphate uridylyltransferase [Actinomycetota bacterium]|nr:galactose-1-phosphate uridylyltransferase [Actinomycetota bacterium]